ncbi:hypothetical protein Fmac_018770 [Flemingia macrophylla]|uniref:Uncharacterized protein n=1 Tax=Flemingia macrophylla TaxID=520843 RepID=A0ABD1M5X7_9FABA
MMKCLEEKGLGMIERLEEKALREGRRNIALGVEGDGRRKEAHIYSGRAACDEAGAATFLHANPLETACYNLYTTVTASKQLQLLHGEEFKKYRTLGLEFYKSELSFPLDSTHIYSGRAACDEAGETGHVVLLRFYMQTHLRQLATASKQLELLHGEVIRC